MAPQAKWQPRREGLESCLGAEPGNVGVGTLPSLCFSIILGRLPMELGRKFREEAEGKEAVSRKSQNARCIPRSTGKQGQPGPPLAFP